MAALPRWRVGLTDRRHHASSTAARFQRASTFGRVTQGGASCARLPWAVLPRTFGAKEKITGARHPCLAPALSQPNRFPLLPRPRRDRHLDRVDPVLVVGVVVEVAAAGGAAIDARHAGDQIQADLDLLARAHVAPVEDQFAAADFEEVDRAALGA